MADTKEPRCPALEPAKASKTVESPKVLGAPVMTNVLRWATQLSGMLDVRIGMPEVQAGVLDHVCTTTCAHQS